MEKIQVKIKRIFEKREGESERGKWAYQDIHVVEDNKEFFNQTVTGWGIETVQVSAF